MCLVAENNNKLRSFFKEQFVTLVLLCHRILKEQAQEEAKVASPERPPRESITNQCLHLLINQTTPVGTELWQSSPYFSGEVQTVDALSLFL